MRKLLLSLIVAFLTQAGIAQTPNNCGNYTTTGSSSASGYADPNAACGALVPGTITGGTAAWSGSSCSGTVVSTVTGPPVNCLTVSYGAVNTNDYATMSTDGGGVLTITAVNCGVSGNVIGPYNCGTGPYGNCLITVCSTVPFSVLTLLNTGCTSGWVINCSTISQTCSMTDLSAIAGACQPPNSYSTTGVLNFTSPPNTGQLIIEDCNGNQDVYNSPFTSPVNYTITGQTADGASCDITAYFTAEPACTITETITAPVSCACTADVGTYTANITGVSGNNYVLCYGDQIDITTNNDWVEPGEMFAPPGPVYDPGVSWLMYSCPPTIGLVANTMNTITDDPCYLGIFSDFDMTDFNDLSTINSYPPGTFTDNTIYFVPITMYAVGTGDYNYVNSSMPCYETGTPYAVQYLPDFTSSNTEDCLAGTATVTVNGALPAVDGSNFTASNLLPANASFNNTTTPDGGDFVISGLIGGDMYSFDVMDANGCAYTITGGPILPLEDPSYSYTGSPWCTSDLVQDPIITGVAGGTFVSSPAGLSINATTGQITPATSTPGQTYDVTHTTPGACYDESTVSITIANDPIVNPIMDQTICDTDDFSSISFTGTGGTNFDWVNDNAAIGLGAAGNTSIPSFVGVGPTNQTVANITVTPSAGSCVGPTQSFVLTVNPPPVVSFTGSISGCEPLMVTLKNTSAPVGQDCQWDLGDGTNLIGCDSIVHEYSAGLFDVSLTVTTNEGCVASLTEPAFIDVFELPVARFSFSPQEIDIDETEVEFDNFSELADSYLWDFADNSPTSIVENPIHLYPQVPGNYRVTLWAFNHNGLCRDSVEQLVIIKDVIIFYVPNVFTPDGDEYNEDFSPVFTSGIDIYDFHLTIFNRWGETIFETFDPSKGWNGHYGDGGLVDDGTYIWQIQFHETMSDRHHEHRGHITVLK